MYKMKDTKDTSDIIYTYYTTIEGTFTQLKTITRKSQNTESRNASEVVNTKNKYF